MKSARIIVPKPMFVNPAWCWRDDWNTGYDSIFSLLAKFAKLNSMGARELVDLFIDRDCGKVTSNLHKPRIDLRSSELFNREALSQHLRLSDKALDHAFMIQRLVNRKHRSCDVLRWCPRCARSGFHSATFQLDLVTACPFHGDMLRTRCPSCRRQIPYQLEKDVFVLPFGCPHCAHDLAPGIRTTRPQPLTLRKKQGDSIDNLVELFVFEDQLIPVRLELNRRRKNLGLGEFAMASADWRRVAAEYTGFVTEVVRQLQPAHAYGQRGLTLSAVSMWEKRMCMMPLYRQSKVHRRRPVSELPIDAQTSSHVKGRWEPRLQSAYAVYGAIRRHLWRGILKSHQACIRSASKHLWWHMEGECTASMCPIAEAFLRWRMHWEGCGTPCYLFGPMRKDPFGVATWLASDAPICPAGLLGDAEQWVCDHVLASHCLASWQDFLDGANANSRRGKITWGRYAPSGRYTPYWAVTGRDTASVPMRLFMQKRTAAATCVPSGASHLLEHRNALDQIRR